MVKKDKKYQDLVATMSKRIYDSYYGAAEIPQSQIKEFFISNGQDLKDFNTFLKDIADAVASMLPQ